MYKYQSTQVREVYSRLEQTILYNWIPAACSAFIPSLFLSYEQAAIQRQRNRLRSVDRHFLTL
jgi:hypothetical protein